jgi:hypothetical protein
MEHDPSVRFVSPHQHPGIRIGMAHERGVGNVFTPRGPGAPASSLEDIWAAIHAAPRGGPRLC